MLWFWKLIVVHTQIALEMVEIKTNVLYITILLLAFYLACFVWKHFLCWCFVAGIKKVRTILGGTRTKWQMLHMLDVMATLTIFQWILANNLTVYCYLGLAIICGWIMVSSQVQLKYCRKGRYTQIYGKKWLKMRCELFVFWLNYGSDKYSYLSLVLFILYWSFITQLVIYRTP